MASDREITLHDVWAAIWRGKWIVVLTTVVAAAIALAFTFAGDATYTASSKVYLGQATTMVGNIASTAGTNPLTAATILQGDDVVAAVSQASGFSEAAVRSAVTISVPRAPGTVSTNQPAVATITVTTTDGKDAVALANAYAQVALTDASGGYNAVESTLTTQITGLVAEERRLQGQLRGGSGGSATTAQQLADLRELLTTSQLQLARVHQIEAPAIVTLARSASSSGSAPNRLRTAITGGVIGLLVGIAVALGIGGGLRRSARSE
ncbi:MAG: hypothetical protein EXQ74_03155 [Thermoleophilia bacterium]|nr:hypothetical protein [Thermoleophilia bacterium]